MDLLNFDVTDDLWNCQEVYWRDGDRWSEFGERRFGARIADSLLKGALPIGLPATEVLSMPRE